MPEFKAKPSFASLQHTLPQSLEEARISRGLSLPQSPSSPDSKIKIPGYELEALLGQGAFAEVWRARQLRTQKSVAVKVFRAHSGPHWLFLQREVERLSMLDKHPHIVSLLDADLSADPPYYAMDLHGRGSLEKWVERAQPIDPGRAARWMEEACLALSYVHSKGLMHCDLKPANLLLDDEDHLRVMDFGHSRILTASGGTLGTFFYMAPEQTRLLDPGRQMQPDNRWDVFSLGCSFYALLSGAVPWGGIAPRLEAIPHLEDKLALMRETMLSQPLPGLHQLGKGGVDRDLAAIIAKCCEADPARRYAGIRDVLADLKARREGLPVSPLKGLHGYNAVKYLRRNRAAVALAGLGLAVLLGAATHRAGQQRRLQQQQLSQLYSLRASERARMGDTLSAAAYESAAQQAFPSRATAWNLQYYLPAAPQFIFKARKGARPEFSPDGERLLALAKDGHAALFSLKNGESEKTFKSADEILSARFSPDGSRIATVSKWKKLRIWEARGRGEKWQMESWGTGRILAWSPDGGTLLALGAPGAAGREILELLDPGKSGQPLFRYSLEEAIRECRFFSSGKGLALLSEAGRVVILRQRKGFWAKKESWEFAAELKAPARPPLWAALSADGAYFCSLGADQRLGLWGLSEEGAKAFRLPEMNGLRLAALGPGSGQLATLNTRRELKAWDLAAGRRLGKPLELGQGVESIRLNSDGTVMVFSPPLARLWDMRQGEAVGRAVYHEAGLESISSADGRWLLQFPASSLGEILAIRAGKPETHSIEFPYRKAGGAAGAGADMSPDGKILFTYWGTSGRFWDLNSGKPLGGEIRAEAGLKGAWFSPDSSLALLKNGGRTGPVYGLKQGARLQATLGWKSPAVAAAFSPSGALATVDAAGRLDFWDSKGGGFFPRLGQARTLTGLSGLAFSPDARELRCLDQEGLLVLDPRDGAPLRRAPLAGNYEKFVLGPDGAAFLSIFGSELRLWDFDSGAALAAPVLLEGEISAAALSTDHAVIAVAYKDGGVRLVEALSGRLLGERLQAGGAVRSMGFSQDGRRLALGSADGLNRLWVLPWLNRTPPRSMDARALAAIRMRISEEGMLEALPYAQWKRAWLRSRQEAQP